MLDNRFALLFIRGERPIADEKNNLLKHPNIHHTPDGGGKSYRYDGLESLPKEISFDASRPEDYELLDGDEFADQLNGSIDYFIEPEPEEGNDSLE